LKLTNECTVGYRSYRFLGVMVVLCFFSSLAQAQQGQPCYTFACLHSEFLNTQVASTYAQYESPTSPATYNASNKDYMSQFTSPSGKEVTVVVKNPVTTSTYVVPSIAAGQSAFDYLTNALYLNGIPRTKTIVQFPPNKTYNITFPLNSNCGSHYVHWQIPGGATDLVIDGQGSTINFSDFCPGISFNGVNRVILKNFTFQWPNLQIASVGTITAVGGNGNIGYTYDVQVPPITGAQPKMLAAISAWDKADNHWDLVNWDQDVSYGDGVTNGVIFNCSATTTGCWAKGITSYGVKFNVGQSVLLRFYSLGATISVAGQDVTLDTITLENLPGSDFTFNGGRGLHVTNLTLTRMANMPVSATGGGSLLTGVTGDVVIDNSHFGYQSDDAFDMNTTMVKFTPTSAANNSPMITSVFNASIPDQLLWPNVYSYVPQKGDSIAIFDNSLNFQGVVKVLTTPVPGSNNANILTLNQNISKSLGEDGFIAADITQSGAPRYVINNNKFQYNRAHALILQTPFGWVDNNIFMGQTMGEIDLSTSQYWGEGIGAQELIISNNHFNGTGHREDFLPLSLRAGSANYDAEIANLSSSAPSVNQNIVVVNNTFTSDELTVAANISSANNTLFSGNNFQLTLPTGSSGNYQYPVSVHDASNVYFDSGNIFSPDGLSVASCTNSRLLTLDNPPPAVSFYPPATCEMAATTSNLVFESQNSIIYVAKSTGGTISPAGAVSVNYGANQTFTVTPDTGYVVNQVLVDNKPVKLTKGQYTFVDVTTTHIFTATFVLQTEIITASAGTGGTISPSGAVKVNYGSNQTIKILPDTGYLVNHVWVDGKALLVPNITGVTWTFTNVTTNHTITTDFLKKPVKPTGLGG